MGIKKQMSEDTAQESQLLGYIVRLKEDHGWYETNSDMSTRPKLCFIFESLIALNYYRFIDVEYCERTDLDLSFNR